jgi:hypothetical protein
VIEAARFSQSFINCENAQFYFGNGFDDVADDSCRLQSATIFAMPFAGFISGAG